MHHQRTICPTAFMRRSHQYFTTMQTHQAALFVIGCVDGGGGIEFDHRTVGQYHAPAFSGAGRIFSHQRPPWHCFAATGGHQTDTHGHTQGLDGEAAVVAMARIAVADAAMRQRAGQSGDAFTERLQPLPGQFMPRFRSAPAATGFAFLLGGGAGLQSHHPVDGEHHDFAARGNAVSRHTGPGNRPRRRASCIAAPNSTRRRGAWRFRHSRGRPVATTKRRCAPWPATRPAWHRFH